MPVRKITRIALLTAILYMAKLVLDFAPNVELITLLVILYTLIFGKEAFLIVTIFNLLQLVQWGPGTWLISYFYVWPLLCVLTILLKRFFKEEFTLWAVFSGGFGLIFGSLFALLYLFVDPAYAFSYWVGGLLWDVWHAAANFVLMLICGKPIYRVLRWIQVHDLV